MPLNHSPKFCLKLIYRYLLKAGHVSGDTLGRSFLVLKSQNTKLCYIPNTNNLISLYKST